MRPSHAHNRLFGLLLLGSVGGCDRRGTRVFMHLPTAAQYLGTSTRRLREYIAEGEGGGLFYDVKKRHKIWSLSLALPSDISIKE